MTKLLKLKSALLAATFATALVAAPSLSWALDDAMLKKTTPSGIEYVFGGVGDASQNVMEGMRKDYNLRLTFAYTGSGEYLRDVNLTVENLKTHENLVEVVSDGPLFFAQLPDGKYKVTANFMGKQKAKIVTIRKNHPRGIVYYFDK